MTTQADEKDFDCLASKDRVQTEIYEQTKGLPRAELREYFHKRVKRGPFADFWKGVRSRQARRTCAS